MEPARVLLVDDRRENLVALEAILEPLGLDFVSVTSGEDALRELLHREFALILLDVQMPGLDGFETAALIKRRTRTRDVPIVFVTAISKQREHVFRGYSAGAVDYLFKPFDPDVLRSKVAALVDLQLRTQELRRQQAELREQQLAEVRRAEGQRYRELAEAMPQIVWVSDAEGKTTYYNRRWFDYTGLDPVTAGEADWRLVVHPDDLQNALKARKRTLASGEEFEVEYRFRSVTGEYRWHLGRAVAMRDDDGTIDHWVGTATDIHDQKRSAEVLRLLLDASSLLGSTLNYRETLRSLARLAVPSMADWCAIEIVEEDGTVIEVAHSDPNKVALARELRDRYAPFHGPGQPVIESGEPQLVPDITDEMLVIMAQDELHLELLRDLRFRSHLCVPMLVRGRVLGAITLVQAESERTYGVAELALAQDLAGRAAVAIENARLHRQAQEQAQAARVLESIGDGVVLVDDDGVVRLWNPAAQAITGLRDADVVGRRLADVAPGWREAAEGRASTLPLDLDGRELWLSVSGVRFADGTVYAFRDLTDERRLEAMRQDLVATVSHELRTPLAAIFGAAVTLQRPDVEFEDDLKARLLQIVVDESNRLADIVNDLLLASQLDSGTLQPAIEATDAGSLAQSVLDAARAHAPAEIELELEAPESVPQVAADPGQLRQVLANLVDNAVKYSPQGGRIAVRLEQSGEQLRIAVRDPGLGIPVGEEQRIFEKFYRLDPDMTQGIGGTGLGLYICNELVRRVDGRIWVESREGEGSTFFVELPLARRREAVHAA